MPPAPSIHRFSHDAMATTFDILIAGNEPAYARQAADAVFAAIDHLETRLSRFNACSDVAQVNHLRPGHSVRVSPDVFECLSVAATVCRDTGGAFDVTIGPVIQCWRDDDGARRTPQDDELRAACAHIGMHQLALTPDDCAVALLPGTASVTIDLGGIGKGFALDKAADILEEWDIGNALLNAGSSTVLALGSPDEASGWDVAVGGVWGTAAGISRVALRDEALSGSGTEIQGDHILDPATGRAAASHRAAWALCPSATVADALSTAFMVMPLDAVRTYCAAHAGVRGFVVVPEGKGTLIEV